MLLSEFQVSECFDWILCSSKVQTENVMTFMSNLFWQMEMVALHWVRCLVRHFGLQVMVVCCQRTLCRCKGMKCLVDRTLRVAAFHLSVQHLEPTIFQGQQHFKKNWEYHLMELYLGHGFINCNFLAASFWIVWFLYYKIIWLYIVER